MQDQEPHDKLKVQFHLKIMEYELEKLLPHIKTMDMEAMPMTYRAKRIEKVLDEIKEIRKALGLTKEKN